MTLARIGLIAVLLCGLGHTAQAMELKEFMQKFSATQNSWERRQLVMQLDPTDKKSRKVLLAVLQQPRFDWYMRKGAIEVFAKCTDADVIKEMEKTKPDKKPLLAEAYAAAFGMAGNVERLDYMIECLKSKKEIVRRSAAINLRHIPDKKIVGALIEAWENEEKFTVWVHMLESLEQVTHEKNLNTAQDWADWWAVNEDSFVLGKAKELSEDEKSGEVFKTKVRGANLTMRSRGKGLPLLVLPDYGFEKDYLETYLRNLEETNQILYMKLPGVVDFDPKLENAPGVDAPFYPLEKVSDAFEGLYKQLVKEGKIKGKFAVLAHGLSCWIAMKFAEKHPKAVRRMILIGASSGSKAAGEGLERIVREGQKRGDLEMEHYGQSRQYVQGRPKYQPKPGDEGLAISRKSFTTRFGDQRNLEIMRLYGPLEGVIKEGGKMPKYVRPMGSCFIPNDFSLFTLRKTAVPTMVMTGKGAIESSIEDAQQIAKFYGRYGKVFVFPRSGEMPFIEENERFVETVFKWLGNKKPKKKKKKKKKK